MIWYKHSGQVIFQGDLISRKVGIGSQYQFAIKPGLIRYLFKIDRHTVFFYLQILPVSLVPDQGFGAFLELFLQ